MAIGLWMGNSDHSNPRSREPAISLTAAAPLWHAFVRDLTNKQPVAELPSARRASSSARIDAWTGGQARARGPAHTVSEWFIRRDPARSQDTRIDRAGPARTTGSCGGWRGRPGQGRARAEVLGRRRREHGSPGPGVGVGVGGQFGTRGRPTSGAGTGWGGHVARSRAPAPKPKPKDDKPGKGPGDGAGHGGDPGAADPAPAAAGPGGNQP